MIDLRDASLHADFLPPIPSGRMIEFSLFRIPVRIHFMFWLVLALFGGALHARTSEDILHVGLFILAGFISILVHELGHALAAKAFGTFPAITLEAFGGYAAFSPVGINRPKSFLITLAGPAIQIALGLAVYFSYPLAADAPPAGRHFLFSLCWVSIFWALLNLLPILPLDGGRLLDSVLGPRRIRITLVVSIIAAILAAIGMALYTQFSNILFPLFMISFAVQAFQALRRM